ncbi:hypothetical protein [Rhodococcoides kyotonense]|uniref:Uncharacterized protein n=1 Tax=Rhodococcoides kyotonense TaxID=398843 RepID=A0A239E5A8_9NOCA|nr:hypothetical protein [Rhodococcus kyotonensis]SNS39905.1 hypothetical protein SAMN05421642_102214 [Rhodococcus kyotonensis]
MADATVSQVDGEIREAQAAIDALEQAVTKGDDTVTAESVSEARSRLSFLQLRRRGAEHREREDNERARRQAVVDAYAERDEFYTNGTAPAREAYAALVDATRAFQVEVRKMWAAHASLGAQAVELGVELRQDLRWEFDFSSYVDEDGHTFAQAAFKEASGQALPRPHGLHDAATHTGHAEQTAREERAERERQAKFEASYETHSDHPVTTQLATS